jgi:RNA polymerase sigma factor (sigma-70 family)
MTHEEFVEYFITKYNSLIKRIANRFTIPNRYGVDDLTQYIAERILHILNAREHKENKIEDPEKYFKPCLEFYCIEFQRMHGYIFCLPKRPRRNAEEDEYSAKQLGFKYMIDVTVDETNSLHSHDIIPEDIILSPETPIWSTLTGVLEPEEASILGCIYLQELTWAETADALGIPQSTCWFRKNKVMKRIEDAICSMSGDPKSAVRGILREDEERINEFRGAYRTVNQYNSKRLSS